MTEKIKLLAIFEWLEDLIAQPDCYGCPFLITITEFPALDYPGHQVAVAHKNQMRDQLIELAKHAEPQNPKELGTFNAAGWSVCRTTAVWTEWI